MNQSIIIEEQHRTVVAQYSPIPRNDDDYQSEAKLEKELISTLSAQGYGTPAIHTEADMLANLADVSKARKLLGWDPEVELDEGLRRTVDWYLQGRDWLKDIRI